MAKDLAWYGDLNAAVLEAADRSYDEPLDVGDRRNALQALKAITPRKKFGIRHYDRLPGKNGKKDQHWYDDQHQGEQDRRRRSQSPATATPLGNPHIERVQQAGQNRGYEQCHDIITNNPEKHAGDCESD